MKDPEAQRITNAWLMDASRGVEKGPSSGPGFRELDQLVAKEPEHAWRVIVAIAEAQKDQRVEAILAAGPLENLISKHGAALIDQIEREAKANPIVKHLLGGVWPHSGTIWQRIEACRGKA